MNSILLYLGGSSAVSIYGILSNAGDVVLQLMYGTTDSLQPAISYNWGAGHQQRVKSIASCGIIASALISLTGMILMLTLPQTIVLLFLKDSHSELLFLASTALRIYSLTYLTRWFGFAIQSLLVALEKPLPASVLSIAYSLAIPIALLPALWRLKLTGIWLNTPLTSLLVSLLALFFLSRLLKKSHKPAHKWSKIVPPPPKGASSFPHKRCNSRDNQQLSLKQKIYSARFIVVLLRRLITQTPAILSITKHPPPKRRVLNLERLPTTPFSSDMAR